MDKDDNIDKQQSLAGAKDRFITSDLEGIWEQLLNKSFQLST